MKYYIDQSIKIENTNKTTYVALTNGLCVLVSISAKEKRNLKLFFRDLDKPLIFKLFTFSVLVAKAIEATEIKQVTIDQEYKGHEIDIKNYVTQLLIISNKPVPQIYIFIKLVKTTMLTFRPIMLTKKKLKVFGLQGMRLLNDLNKLTNKKDWMLCE